jgi:hypothetical protein
VSGLGETLRAILNRISDAIDNANGDVVEAMRGHVCDADCWHNAWVGLQRPHWLGDPADGREHAFPEAITRPGRRKRHYSACGRASLSEPLYFLARKGRCEVCARVVGG